MEFLFSKWVSAFLLCCWFSFSIGHSVVGLHGNARVRAVNLGGWLVIEGWIKPSLFDDIPNGDMLDGTQVQFKSVTLQKYVSAQNGGGLNVTVDRDDPLEWETFKLWRVSESVFQFRTSEGNFLTCSSDGGIVTATAESPSDSETFYIERNFNNRVHIKLKGGTYIQVGMIILRHLRWRLWESCKVTISLLMDTDTTKQKKFLRHGINAVRIPVGWWIASNSNPPAPFIGGSLEALDNAFSWAQAYGIKCIIDLHAGPGSQNGMEHSASRDGTVNWPTSPEFISQTLDAIEFLASRYAVHPALLGIELLNEPSAADVPLDVLVPFYKQGYKIVRKYSTTAYVIFCQRIGNADPFELYQANIGSLNTVVDLHYYNLFDRYFDILTSLENIQFIYKSRQSQIQALNSANGPLVFVGEWVNEWNVTNGSLADYQDFGRVQLDVYNAASFGWSYWTLKCEKKHWDFEWSVRNNYLQLQPGVYVGKSPGKRISRVILLLGAACIWIFLH
ncbi:putative glucan 1,3-beta-glucosidase A isoform X2 [Nicotiana tabacum]|uniref:Glucan 1,3-beta-glucosidase A isoform X2 n=2 Tax=Nicotiana TaxID=4085 RepID=A0A1S4A0E9_TOBAC|nr:PREDICTED: probable glucan 1,3-beta-glucosidase A isoform X2 [Nicotiana sylvestris]XP_016470079.1 PREDICTED: probable glucan 1,3-beta-glucosidase A isoform X2 [Nicotiana tabacum]